MSPSFDLAQKHQRTPSRFMDSSSSKPVMEGPRRHERYYWVDGNVVFLIDNYLFRVHRYLFEQSEVFRAMFTLPAPAGGGEEGQSDENPVAILGVSATAFEYLLWYMYPGFHEDIDVLSVHGWVHILDLATMFAFDRIRANAIVVLQRCPDPVFRLSLADKYHVDNWLLGCYVELCTRPAFLTEQEMRQIGRESSDRLLRARELVRSYLFRRAHGQGAVWPCTNPKETRRKKCRERMTSHLCEALLRTPSSTETLVPYLFSVVGPTPDGQLREEGLCGSCAIAWDKVIWPWLGMHEIRKILKTVFGKGTCDRSDNTQTCQTLILTNPNESDHEGSRSVT